MNPIDRAIDILDGQGPLAEAIGVKQSFISQIRTGARPIPAARCADIEEATGGKVTCCELRPDVFKKTKAA